IPEYVKVLNLLENDAILSSAWEIGQNFVSTLPVGSFQVDTTVVKSPVDKLERNLFVTGLPKDAIVYVNGKIQQFLSDLILIGSVGNYSDFTVVIESPWVSKSLVIKNVIPLLPGYVAFCDVSSYVTSLGHLLIPRPDLSLKLQRIEEDEQYIPMELSSLGYFAKLAPGQYVVLGRLLGDSYDSFTSTLTVEAEKEIVFDPGPVGFSLKYRYEESLREQELLREELNKLAPMKTAGLSALGIATAGAVGTVVSYLLYSTAVQNYNDAIISSDLTRYRNDAALWSRVFTASLATGIAGGVTGGTVFAINAPETNRLSKRLEEQEILATELRNQIGAQNAREAMNAYTASSKVDFISLSEEDLFGKEAVLWFSLVGGTMDEPNQKNVTLGSRLGPLPIPKRSGYSFAGWWTDLGPNGIEVTPTTQVMKSDPFVMYAKWKDL
ncbi:MAG: InlB B-repeat-containing protein, partial [Sphaerochaeta sp.]|nr:InlB B-repeat-containing protein [Sphaerochaeta sp.]